MSLPYLRTTRSIFPSPFMSAARTALGLPERSLRTTEGENPPPPIPKKTSTA